VAVGAAGQRTHDLEAVPDEPLADTGPPVQQLEVGEARLDDRHGLLVGAEGADVDRSGLGEGGRRGVEIAARAGGHRQIAEHLTDQRVLVAVELAARGERRAQELGRFGPIHDSVLRLECPGI
jgi:hypothetical protein